MKLFCIGRNYAKHAEELNNAIPDEPLVFMKPATALLKPGQDFYYPNFSTDIHFECELVLQIGKNGKNIHPNFAFDYIKQVSLGIDFTARDLQSKLKAKGHPWEKAKAFDFSAPVGTFLPAESIKNWENISFQLYKNEELVQDGNTKNLLFSIPTLVSHISSFFTLQTGDLIFTGTPEGVGSVKIGDKLKGILDSKEVLKVAIK